MLNALKFCMLLEFISFYGEAAVPYIKVPIGWVMSK